MEYELDHSDTLDDVVGDYLMHYGVSVDDGAPGPGSGRYPKGSGERPFQRDPEMLAKKKKRGLFGVIKAVRDWDKRSGIEGYDDLATTLISKGYGQQGHNTQYQELSDSKEHIDPETGRWKWIDKELLDKYDELHKKSIRENPEKYTSTFFREEDGKKKLNLVGDTVRPDADLNELKKEWKAWHDLESSKAAEYFTKYKNKEKQNKARLSALEKARETKATNKAKAEEEKKSKEEREAEKAKAIASGDPEQISKWLSEMSNQEQFDALNRIRQTKDIKSQAAAQVKAREDAAKAEEARRKAEEEAKRPKTKKELRDEKLKESFETAKDIMNTVDDVRQMAEKGIKFWNVIAAVNNASNPDFKLPKVDLNTGDKKKDKDKEENKENKEKDKNKNQQNNSGSTTNTNSNNTTYNTTNNYYNGEKKEDKPESETEAETWRPSGMEDWYDAPYKYEEAGKLLLEDFMKRKK